MKNLDYRPMALTSVAFALFAGGAGAQSGHVLNGVGAVNQGMAGVSTGLTTDASGAINWNPAAITAVDCCDMQFSMELFESDLELASSMGAAGSTTPCGRGPSAIPSFAMIHDLGDSGWTFGLGAFGVAGFGVDFEADAANPILMPPPNGFGQVFSEYQMLQVTPTFSKQVDEHWSFGFAPTINQARLRVHPAPFASPDDADGDGTPSYPSAAAGSDSWGFGGQVGVYYDSLDDWTFGASYKSTQYFETYEFNAVDELGMPRELKFDMDFPAIASVGFGYAGIDRWKLGLDIRHIDYANTDGFSESGFDATGAVKGFGWDSISVVALAAQYEATADLTLRGGFSFNGSPIDRDNVGFNVAAPAVIEKHLALGATYAISEHMLLDLAWHHGFENEVSGPMQNPMAGGPVPGTSVEPNMSTDSLIFGLRLAL